jgi:hypothetical protein
MRRERDEVRGSMLASRSVVSVLSRSLGDFLYTLKAGPAGGRQGRAFQGQAGLRATRKELQSLRSYVQLRRACPLRLIDTTRDRSDFATEISTRSPQLPGVAAPEQAPTERHGRRLLLGELRRPPLCWDRLGPE